MHTFVPMMKPLAALRAAADTGSTTDFVFAWERENGCAYRYRLPIPMGRESDPETIRLAERMVKFVLWAMGGWRLHLAGAAPVCDAVAAAWSAGGPRDFDRDMMFKAYGRHIEIKRCAIDAVPETRDAGQGAGVSWTGCRIGFDLGASDFKIAAVEDGEVRFSEEFGWDPRNATDPAYHFDQLDAGLRAAAEKLPRVDAIGGSTAGIVVANEMRVASLFRAIPADRYAEAQGLFKAVERVAGARPGGERRGCHGFGGVSDHGPEGGARHRDGFERGGRLSRPRGRDHRPAQRAGLCSRRFFKDRASGRVVGRPGGWRDVFFAAGHQFPGRRAGDRVSGRPAPAGAVA